jgi:hypothetical protein
MPVTCPNCGTNVSSAEERDGWCETCGKKLPGHHISTNPFVRSEPEVTTTDYGRSITREVPRLTTQESLSWGTVRAGLIQITIGMILMLISLPVLMFFMFLPRSYAPGGGFESRFLEQFMTMLATVALGTGAIFMLIGTTMGWAAPERSETRGGARLAVLFLCVSVGLTLFMVTAQSENQRAALRFDRDPFGEPRFAPQAPPFSDGVLLAVRLGTLAVSLLQWICFLVFLISVARYFGNGPLSTQLIIYLVAVLVFWAAALALSFLPSTGRFADMTLVAIGVLVLVEGMGIWFTILAGAVRRTISRALIR